MTIQCIYTSDSTLTKIRVSSPEKYFLTQDEGKKERVRVVETGRWHTTVSFFREWSTTRELEFEDSEILYSVITEE